MMSETARRTIFTSRNPSAHEWQVQAGHVMQQTDLKPNDEVCDPAQHVHVSGFTGCTCTTAAQ